MSINNDIRVRSNTSGRTFAVIAAAGAIALALSFGLSFLPAIVSADPLPVCHDHQDNNGGNGIDMKDSDCWIQANETPEALNQYATTTAGVPVTLTLTGTDADNDFLYFSISEAVNINGTLSCAGLPCVQYNEFASSTGTLPTITYTPDLGFSGDIQIDFTVSDGHAENDATVFIHVDAAAPVIPSCSNTTTFDTFSLGSVNGQGGWGVTGPYDQAVVSNTYGFATFGCQTFRISNSTASGSFGDQTFSNSTTNEAGETDAQTSAYSGGSRQNHFESQFDIASASTTLQPGLIMSVSSDRGDGARMSYLRFEDQTDGIHVFSADYIDAAPKGSLAEPALGCGIEDDWTNDDIATLDRSVPHTIKFSIDFVDGSANDVLKVYVDGVLKHTGTTWEDYFRWCAESGGGVVDSVSADVSRTVDSMLFRVSAAAPVNAGKGFLIDNFSLSTGATPIVDPTCAPGQHIDNHVCVADPVVPSSGGNSNGGGNGGGAPVSGPLSIGFVNTNNGGQVLGASTDLPFGCSAYLNAYLKKGSSNSAEVKKLQNFLNKELGLTLPVSGIFGSLTFNAVSAFQTKYANEVLKPWFDKKLSGDLSPSGYAYKMTVYKINLLQCASLNTPVPQLP